MRSLLPTQGTCSQSTSFKTNYQTWLREKLRGQRPLSLLGLSALGELLFLRMVWLNLSTQWRPIWGLLSSKKQLPWRQSNGYRVATSDRDHQRKRDAGRNTLGAINIS